MHDPFVKNPCRYPDEVRARAPRGFRDQVKRAAQVERLPVSEFIRRAVSDRIEAVTRHDGNDPDPFRPAPGQRIAA
jgi:hypothetical protein